MKRPETIGGLHHVALKVADFAACETFYTELLGFEVEWRPDDDNVYLTTGSDNLALHRDGARPAAPSDAPNGAPNGALDHIGIVLPTPDDVDAWHAFLVERGVTIEAAPKTHRDGARSFYCRDPDGNCVQMIYHPPLAPPPPAE